MIVPITRIPQFYTAQGARASCIRRPNYALVAAIALPALLTSLPPVRAQTAADLAAAVWLETLDLSQMTTGWAEAHAGLSVDNHSLTLKGTVYPHGVGTHAVSSFRVLLHGGATRFSAVVGADDETKGHAGSVTFQVIVDGMTAAQTPVMRVGDEPQLISVDLTGAQEMILKIGDGDDGTNYDHADWAGAEITLASDASPKPEARVVPVSPPRLVVPAADPKPAIHGPRVAGVTPDHPFLFRVPATGDGPLTFTAKIFPQDWP